MDNILEKNIFAENNIELVLKKMKEFANKKLKNSSSASTNLNMMMKTVDALELLLKNHENTKIYNEGYRESLYLFKKIVFKCFESENMEVSVMDNMGIFCCNLNKYNINIYFRLTLQNEILLIARCGNINISISESSKMIEIIVEDGDKLNIKTNYFNENKKNTVSIQNKIYRDDISNNFVDLLKSIISELNITTESSFDSIMNFFEVL